MAFKTDSGGIAFKCSDAKLQANANTWATKLSQLASQTGIVRIVTYSLPDMNYVHVQLGRRPRDIVLIAHSKFLNRATDIRREFLDIRVAVQDQVHSKVLLIAKQSLSQARILATAIGTKRASAFTPKKHTIGTLRRCLTPSGSVVTKFY